MATIIRISVVAAMFVMVGCSHMHVGMVEDTWDFDDHHLFTVSVSDVDVPASSSSGMARTKWTYDDHYLAGNRVSDTIDHIASGGSQVLEWNYDLFFAHSGSVETEELAYSWKQ